MERKEASTATEQLDTPTFVIVLRAAIRPVVTLALTATFIFLLVKRVDAGKEQAKAWQDMLTVFLAVDGPIVGFWFGQQTALKQRQ